MIRPADLPLNGPYRSEYFDSERSSRWVPVLVMDKTFLRFNGPGFVHVESFLDDLSDELLLASRYGYEASCSLIVTISGRNYLIIVSEGYYLVKSCAIDSNNTSEIVVLRPARENLQ